MDKHLDRPPMDPAQEKAAWDAAVTALKQGGGSDQAARKFFGKLLKTHGLRASDMATPIKAALVSGTQDPHSYLWAAAERLVDSRKSPALGADWT